MAVGCYLSTTSAAPGDTVGLFLSGNASIAIRRFNRPALLSPRNVAVAGQPAPLNPPWEGFGWQQSDTVTVDPSWETGLYEVVDTTGGGATVVNSFVVRPANPVAPVLLHVSYLTPQAYIPSGGKSLYNFNSDVPQGIISDAGHEDSRALRVSFDRPGVYPGVQDQIIGEQFFITWAESQGIALDYCSSVDLHDQADLLGGYQCLVIVGHDEYWTAEMYDHAERFVANGGNMVNLSGNTCWRQVRLEDDERTVAFYKYAGDDPNTDSRQTTVAYPDPPLFRPTNRLLGVGWGYGAFQDPSLPAAPYQFHFTDHWVFAGTGGPPASVNFLNYESDAAAHLFETLGDVTYPYVTGDDGTTTAFTVLGSADLRGFLGKPGYSTMGLYRRGGTVFSGGSTEWIKNLNNSVLARITANVLSRLSAAQDLDWEEVGPVDAPQAMAASRDRLWLVNGAGRLWRRHPVGANVPWSNIGDAPGDVVAMAFAGNTLFALDAGNHMFSRPAVEADVAWSGAGDGPAGGPGPMAAASGMLYVLDRAGVLHRARAPLGSVAGPGPLAWSELPAPGFARADSVTTMTAVGDLLFGATSDGRLVRSDHDFIGESTGWVDAATVEASVGLAAVEHMLFAATQAGTLCRFDLAGARVPKWS